jgi:hypothetical protein
MTHLQKQLNSLSSLFSANARSKWKSRAVRMGGLAILLVCVFSGKINAQSGPTYYYVVTAQNAAGFESAYSNQVVATFATGQHNAVLAWTASTSTVVGYNIYRASTTGGPYTRVNATLVSAVTYTDTFVLPNAPSGLGVTLN